jgi:hypothetical protein
MGCGDDGEEDKKREGGEDEDAEMDFFLARQVKKIREKDQHVLLVNEMESLQAAGNSTKPRRG